MIKQAINLSRKNLFRIFSRCYEHCINEFEEHHLSAPYKIQIICITAIWGYIGYWFVWTEIIPQDYENLPLRITCTTLAVIILAKPFWPRFLAPYYYPATYAVFTACLPFFFTYMMLFSGMTDQIVKSALAAFFFILLLFDLLNMILSAIIGVATASLVFYLSRGVLTFDQWALLYETIFIMGFAFWGVVVLIYSAKRIHKDKMHVATTLAGVIAHEMRTPLTGIPFDVKALERKINKAPNKALSSGDLKRLNATTRRIEEQTILASERIDETLKKMILKEEDRNRINCNIQTDFDLQGDPTLLRHRITNLVQNALNAIRAKNRGDITIRTYVDENEPPNLEVADTGIGIDKEHIRHIFKPWYSNRPDSTSCSGLGLPFVKKIFDSVGGAIAVVSIEAVGTVFRITLPALSQENLTALGKAA